MKARVMIDHAIVIDLTGFPDILLNIIKECEKYDASGEWWIYDNMSDALESCAKSCLINKKITEKQFELLLKKYGGYN